MKTVENRIATVVADVFGLEPGSVTQATSADAVENWDSVNILHLVLALDAEFGVSITPDEAADFLSVRLITEVLREKGIE
jgi:acyl carrier protein